MNAVVPIMSDPITINDVKTIRQSLDAFDKVIVALSTKRTLYTIAQSKRILALCFTEADMEKCTIYGSLCDYYNTSSLPAEVHDCTVVTDDYKVYVNCVNKGIGVKLMSKITGYEKAFLHNAVHKGLQLDYLRSRVNRK